MYVSGSLKSSENRLPAPLCSLWEDLRKRKVAAEIFKAAKEKQIRRPKIDGNWLPGSDRQICESQPEYRMASFLYKGRIIFFSKYHAIFNVTVQGFFFFAPNMLRAGAPWPLQTHFDFHTFTHTQ
ncbi:unnamed protein product [Lepidochelys kempii]